MDPACIESRDTCKSWGAQTIAGVSIVGPGECYAVVKKEYDRLLLYTTIPGSPGATAQAIPES